MRAQRVLVSPEYSTTGLWSQEAGVIDDVDWLPVSADLRARIIAWAARWEESEFYEPPENRRPFDLASFVLEGRRIALAIKLELPGWTVLYHDYSKDVCARGEAVETLGA